MGKALTRPMVYNTHPQLHTACSEWAPTRVVVLGAEPGRLHTGCGDALGEAFKHDIRPRFGERRRARGCCALCPVHACKRAHGGAGQAAQSRVQQAQLCVGIVGQLA